MLLGVVLHSALPYVNMDVPDWPSDKSDSEIISIIVQFIHLWRMPVFFILSGFFANLLISRNGLTYWWKNRVSRILLPLIIFSLLMMTTLPWIVKFGYTQKLEFFYSFEGYPYHLWFLWHLLIFLVLSVILKLYFLIISKLLIFLKLNKLINLLSKTNHYFLKFVFYSKIPIPFILVISIFSLGETGPDLILNPVLSGLYFMFGYQIFNNHNLQNIVRTWKYYSLISIFFFVLYTLINIEIIKLDFESHPIYGIPYILIYNFSSVFFALFFIGLFECKLINYSKILRIFSDSAYWIYLIHLPIVAFITFFMFKFDFSIELKFMLSILLTTLISYISYKYLVRPSYLAVLLNGKKRKFSWKMFE